MKNYNYLLWVFWIVLTGCSTEEKADFRIDVDLSKTKGELIYDWAYFGHDEANWATTTNGEKLIADLSEASPVRVTFRAHHLFTSGDPASTRLKWSPTNVYTEDELGNPVYNWEQTDKILDNYLKYNVRPMIELGFMPQDMSRVKEPYDHIFKKTKIKDLGWSYPPKDYKKWAGLIEAFARHSVERYGREEVDNWIWEVWNEPDIFFWQGTTEEYLMLYDYAIDAVLSVLPNAFVGGPAATAPKTEKSAIYLREFLDHCFNGVNYATGEQGCPLKYVSFHTKGAPELVDGRVRMGLKRQLTRADWALSVIAEFEEAKDLPIYITESDPEGTAAYNVADRPENIFRQGSTYPVYNIVVAEKLRENARKYGLELYCNLTWAFMFEGSDYFEGFRELSTNGINKAVFNGFKMLGMMKGDQASVVSSGYVDLNTALEGGIQDSVYVDAVAAIDEKEATILIWNYHDHDLEVPASKIAVQVIGLPADQVTIEHYRIDDKHSNPYTLWLEMDSPQPPTQEQINQLQKASALALFEPGKEMAVNDGTLNLTTDLPRYGLSLFKLIW